MSEICSDCGNEITFRHIGGRVIPLGCRCHRESIPAKIEEHSAFKTTCPICQASVYFVRHNGGSVWLDDLGNGWPKHPCFADKELGVNSLFPGIAVSCIGTVRLTTYRDWQGRPVFYASCTSYSGYLLVLGSRGELPADGDIISLSNGLTLLHTSNGGIHQVSSDVRRCRHCDEYYLWNEYELHTANCLKKDFIDCPHCKQRFHWTEYSVHQQTHSR